MNDKLEQFRAHLESEQLRGLIAQNYDPKLHGYAVQVKIGRKYANVDTGGPSWSGRYMVELSTGAIYGIKAYGVIHRGHYYGTLDTIADYDWSGYKAFKRAQVAA